MLVLLPSIVFALSALALPPSDNKSGILGLLGGNSDASNTSHAPDPTRLTLPTVTRSSASPSLSTSHSSATQWSSAFTTQTDSAGPTAAQTPPPSTPSIPPASAESHAIDHSSKTWQIIGIAIIAVLFVATSIACAMFFDRLWRLLKDVLGCTPRPPLSEEFIPDCEKQTWDTRSISPSPSDHKGKLLQEEASVYTMRTRELPWNTDTQDWNPLHRQPSRRNDHAPPA